MLFMLFKIFSDVFEVAGADKKKSLEKLTGYLCILIDQILGLLCSQCMHCILTPPFLLL